MSKPWIDGPKELLKHAGVHLHDGTDFDNRIAFISIDNSIELTIKTYLSLPKRIRKKEGPSRKELHEAENSFPAYLDLLEKYDSDKISDINLDDIEWFHRLRNELYHNGNGITVDKSKVESYFEISKALFENVFSESISTLLAPSYETTLGMFMSKWTEYEKALRAKLPPKNGQLAYYWKRDFLKTIDPALVPLFNEVMEFRNNVMHADTPPKVEEYERIISLVDYLKGRLVG